MIPNTFDLWRIRALSFAQRLRFSPELVNQAIGILSSVFRADWIDLVTEKPTLGSPYPIREHPIGAALHVAGENQVIGLLELVEYLKSAATSPVLPSVVDNLKAQYDSTLLQLAFAHRFTEAGAESLSLEPPVAGGRVGDIAFRLENQGYIAECYIPGSGVLGNSLQEVEWLTKQAIEAINDEHLILSVAVELRDTLTAIGRKELVQEIISMSNELKQQSLSGGSYPPPLLHATTSGTVSVGISTRVRHGEESILVLHKDFPVPREEHPDTFLRVQWARKSEVFRAQNQVIKGEYGSHIAVWLSPDERKLNTLKVDLEDPLSRLTKKLKRKLAQTKLGPEWQRMLIVQTWMVDELNRASDDDLGRLRRRIFDQHTGVAAVLLVLRHWDERIQRFVYHTRVLLPDEPTPTFRDWVESVCTAAETTSYPAITSASAS